MRVVLVSAVVLAGMLAAAASGAGRTPLVPAIVQARIAAQAPSLAYVPTRIATGFRYRSWQASATALRIWFANRAGWRIAFVVVPSRGDCRAGMEKSFQLDGNKVYWSHTEDEQQAWRCVARPGGGRVRLVAASAEPPTRFADVGLGIVAASGKRIG